ncbi:MAG: Rab family GTPase [Promethearchaeota archaeon]
MEDNIPTSEQFNELLGNFARVVPDVVAVIVSDHDGLVVASTSTIPGSGESVEEQIGAISTIINPILVRLRDEFSFKTFGTASFDTEEFRLIFVDTGKDVTISIVLDQVASVDATFPLAYLLAEKTARILEGKRVEVTIPRIGFHPGSDEEQRRLKNNLYQLRLKEGSYKFKFIIIGDASVGKTSLIVRFVENKFTHDYRATIGLNVLTHSYEMMSGEIGITLSIWDIGSQAYFKRVRRTYYTGAHASFIVFDLTNRESFENVREWLRELEDFVGRVPFLLVGNKLDLEGERQVSAEEAITLAEELGASYMETSAKTGANVEDSFTLMAYKLLENALELEERTIKEDLENDLGEILGMGPLRVAIINDNPLWNPFLNFFLEMCSKDSTKPVNTSAGQEFKFERGLTVKKVVIGEGGGLGEKMAFIRDSRAIIFLFSEKNLDKVSDWKRSVVETINSTPPGTIITVGIKTAEAETWLEITEEFDINDELESHPEHSVFFFRLSHEYRLEVLDNLKTLLDALKI